MTCLSLFQQLCNLARIATANMDSHPNDGYVVGMDHMWKIALRANNTGQYIIIFLLFKNIVNEITLMALTVGSQ